LIKEQIRAGFLWYVNILLYLEIQLARGGGWLDPSKRFSTSTVCAFPSRGDLYFHQYISRSLFWSM